MKLLKNKVLTSSLLVLVFSVAVSGGCGGGSSGHSSGNYGQDSNSGQNVTAEYVSQDTPPPFPRLSLIFKSFLLAAMSMAMSTAATNTALITKNTLLLLQIYLC